MGPVYLPAARLADIGQARDGGQLQTNIVRVDSQHSVYITVTAELLKQANTALDLATTRYDLGLSSIVELSQAELQETEAAIGNANARSQYNFAISTINFQTGVQP